MSGRLTIHVVNQRLVALFYETAAQFHCCGQFFIFGGQQHVDQAKILDLLHPREFAVYLRHFGANQVLHRLRAAKRREIRKRHLVILGKFFDVFLVDHHKAGQKLALVTNHHGVRNIGAELQAAFNFRRGDVFAPCGDDDILDPPGDDDKGEKSGSVYLFEGSGGTWTKKSKLVADDGAAGDQFGECVSISEDKMVVGAPYHDGVGVDSGSYYWFQV